VDPASLGRFDVVHSAHVIEHLSSPKMYLAKCFELLSPGGLCVFFTPNTDTWDARAFGPDWGGLHVPRHWFLLNESNAREAVERAGMTVLDVSYSTNGVFWVWSLHSWLQRRNWRRLADALFASDRRIVSNSPLNIAKLGFFALFDALTVQATGKSSNMLVIARRP
jgi:cyclopropane fatty-acyl-phospholipid synthase-like methyltransferase